MAALRARQARPDGRRCFACEDTDRRAKISHQVEGELPSSRFRFDFPQFFVLAALAGGLGRLVFTRIKPHTFLSHDDFTNHDLLRDFTAPQITLCTRLTC